MWLNLGNCLIFDRLYVWFLNMGIFGLSFVLGRVPLFSSQWRVYVLMAERWCVCWWPNGGGVWWIDYECFVGLISRECLACVADPLIWPSRARGTHWRPTPSRKFVEGDEQNAVFWWGHFRQVWPKKLTCWARGCISVSSNGAIGQKGVDCKFLQLSWVQLKQSKHWYQNYKLM